MWNEAQRKEKQRRGTEGEWSRGCFAPTENDFEGGFT